MKVVLFATPEFAIPTFLSIHNSSHEIQCVITVPDKKSGRGLKPISSPVKDLADKLGYKIIQPYSFFDKSLINELKNINSDLFIVIAFKILPEILFNIPRYGSINVHASLLPKYRGSAPIQHAILNGDKITGLTAFQINKCVDTGKILKQKKYSIDGNATYGEVYNDLSNLSGNLIISLLNEYSNNNITMISQNNKYATTAKKISTTDCRINWNSPNYNIHNHIRAFSPKPGAYTYYKNKRIKLFSSYIANNNDYQLLPGEILYLNNRLYIGTNTNAISIQTLQFEGKNILSVNDILNGRPELNGSFFK